MEQIQYIAMPELRKLCKEDILQQLVATGVQRFKERGHELGDGIFCCRMIMPQLSEEDRMILFILQKQNKDWPPVVMMLWREAVAADLLPILQEMINSGTYRAGPGSIAFPELLRNSGVYVPEKPIIR